MPSNVNRQYDRRIQDARVAQRNSGTPATRRGSSRDVAAQALNPHGRDAYLPGLPRGLQGRPTARQVGLTAAVALLLLNPAAAALAQENLRETAERLPRGARRAGGDDALARQGRQLRAAAAARAAAPAPLPAESEVGASLFDDAAESMTFGFVDDAGQNATALACTPTNCEAIDETPDVLLPVGAALNETVSDPARLEAGLRIVSQLARQQSAADPQVSLLAQRLIAELRTNPALADVAAAVGDSLSPAVWGFVNALVTQVKPGVENPAAVLAVTEQALQALYPSNVDVAVFALQAMAQNGTLAHFIVPQNETLAAQPEASAFAVPANATTYVSPFAPQQPWLDVALTSENATRADFRRSALGQFTGNHNTVLDRTEMGSALPAAWGGSSAAQALMNCFVTIQGVGAKWGVNLLPAGTPDDASGLFALGASAFTGDLGSHLVGDRQPSLQVLMSQVSTAMARAQVSSADQASVRAAYTKAATLIEAYSPSTLSDGAAPLRGTEPLVVRDGGIYMRHSGKRFTGFGVNIDDVRGCGSVEGRTTDEVKRRISEVFAQPGINFVRMPMDMSDDVGTVATDPAYWQSVQDIVAHVATFPGKYLELSVWHMDDLAANAGPSWGTLDVWMFMKDMLVNSPHVIVGLVNEPVDFAHNDMMQLHGGFQIMIDSLRQAGVKNVINVSGSQYGRVVTDQVAHPFHGGNVVAETHAYGTLEQVNEWIAPCLTDLVCMISEAGVMNEPEMGVVVTPEDFAQMMVNAHEAQIPFAAWDYSGACPPNLLRPEVESLNAGNGQKLALSEYGELFFGMARNLTEG